MGQTGGTLARSLETPATVEPPLGSRSLLRPNLGRSSLRGASDGRARASDGTSGAPAATLRGPVATGGAPALEGAHSTKSACSALVYRFWCSRSKPHSAVRSLQPRSELLAACLLAARLTCAANPQRPWCTLHS